MLKSFPYYLFGPGGVKRGDTIAMLDNIPVSHPSPPAPLGSVGGLVLHPGIKHPVQMRVRGIKSIGFDKVSMVLLELFKFFTDPG